MAPHPKGVLHSNSLIQNTGIDFQKENQQRKVRGKD